MDSMDAWYYARKSPSDTDEQVGVDGQKVLCIGEIERRGWRAAGGFEDVAKSAYEAQFRPGYEALLEAIRAGRVGAVVVRHNDRLHRDVEEYKAFIRLIRKHKVEVVAVLGGDWSVETAAGRFSGTMLAAVAEYESSLKAERVNVALLRRAEAGLPANTRFRALGFEDDGVTHRPVEVEQLRRAADDLLAGRRSLGAVAREAGRTVTGMRKILTNVRLVGEREFQGQTYPATWLPVLDRETFDALAVLLGKRAIGTARPGKWLLTGLAWCGSCGKRLQARQTRGVNVYGCLTAAGNECPKKVQRKAERLDAFVVTSVLHALTESGRTPMAAAADTEAALAAVRGLETRLAEIEQALEDADGGAVAALTRAYSGIERKLAEAKAQVTVAPMIGGLEPGSDGWDRVLTDWEAWWAPRDKETPAALLERRRALLASELSGVEVGPAPKGRLPFDGDTVTLHWRQTVR
jgi:site-specific DNA recombinase